ncbi:MAG: ketopantoate reductase [Archangium sp.]|nr:ketopantoate reductase [Archangium sp.]
MNVLVVGAGAVGQVFALSLARGGATVSFLVRPKHGARDALQLFEQGGEASTLTAQWLTSLDALKRQSWDQVWLAVPATAYEGDEIPRVLEATGDTTVVVLATEGGDLVPAARRVLGAIPFMAWQHPLPGQPGAPGVAYWWPPLAQVPLSGVAPERVEAVRALLRRGGLRAQRVDDVAKLGAPVTALLNASVVALEAAGWKLRDFHGRWTTLAARAAREMMRIDGVSPVFRAVTRGPALRVVWWLAAKVVPFDLEAYVQFHFTKMGEQTRAGLGRWIRDGRERGLPVDALEALKHTLPR